MFQKSGQTLRLSCTTRGRLERMWALGKASDVRTRVFQQTALKHGFPARYPRQRDMLSPNTGAKSQGCDTALRVKVHVERRNLIESRIPKPHVLLRRAVGEETLSKPGRHCAMIPSYSRALTMSMDPGKTCHGTRTSNGIAHSPSPRNPVAGPRLSFAAG